MTKAVTELLSQFKERFGDYTKLAQFDDGKEFYNVGVKTLLEKHDIKYFSTNSDKKAAVVERFNRTLKTAMWKYFYSKGTYKWIDILDQLVYNYNNTKHSTILMKPKDGNKKNEDEVWTTLYGHISRCKLWALEHFLILTIFIHFGKKSLTASSTPPFSY